MRTWIWIIWIFTGFWYNQYFGWNAFPKNDAEMVCDMLYGMMSIMVISKLR